LRTLMNITLFIGSIYGGGAERVACDLSSYLADRGNNVEILIVSDTEKHYKLHPNVKVVPLLSIDKQRSFIHRTIVRLLKFWKYLLLKRNVDAYVVMLPKTISFFMKFRWMTKAKVILSERADPSVCPLDVQKDMKKCAAKSNGFVFQTKDARDWYENSIKAIPTVIIPNAVSSTAIRPIYKGIREKTIVAAGRLSDQKNFPLLINSFALLANEYNEWNVIIYGDGNCRDKLQEQINLLGLQSRISLPGNVTDLAERISTKSVFVLTSNYEGMPNALIEAMAMALSCISTDCPVGGPRFLIEDGVNGLLVPVGDVEKMAQTLKLVLSNENYRNELGREASKIIQRLNPEKIYNQWEEFIKIVVSEPHSQC
jgi:glycosyltransferase involved in cell wall biosynthesis